MEFSQKDSGLNLFIAWWPVLLGFSLLYVPTYLDMAQSLWGTEAYLHGPMVLAVSMWLAWQRGAEGTLFAGDAPSFVPGLLILVTGLLMYALGRSQSIWLLEAGSQIPVLAGTALATRGRRTLKAFSFPLLFLVFLVPLPGALVDAMTGPLKQYVSVIAEHLLYAFGYPIARNGVMITIGQYQLLVADACSGLHSMFSLSAMGLLYVHLMQYRNRLQNGLMIASILPIAFITNVIRVIILVLVTYYFGDAAGQGIVHGFAGLALFVIGLAAFFVLDSVMRRVMANGLPQTP